ncbi:unnamed protein product, partial [Mesorhabditis belari]|uniref:Ground-like domain-containing protein n=1 Tax=Mesorhabditis belari TaxID=2138241 RepID=A0AAF3JC93_9BILA
MIATRHDGCTCAGLFCSSRCPNGIVGIPFTLPALPSHSFPPFPTLPLHAAAHRSFRSLTLPSFFYVAPTPMPQSSTSSNCEQKITTSSNCYENNSNNNNNSTVNFGSSQPAQQPQVLTVTPGTLMSPVPLLQSSTVKEINQQPVYLMQNQVEILAQNPSSTTYPPEQYAQLDYEFAEKDAEQSLIEFGKSWRMIILENIDTNPSTSKRKVQKAATNLIGGLFDVICSQNDFSYLANTQLFCEAGNGEITCFAFLHSALRGNTMACFGVDNHGRCQSEGNREEIPFPPPVLSLKNPSHSAIYSHIPSISSSLDWCHYFRLLKREHTRPECYGVTESRLRLARRKEQHLQQVMRRWRQSYEESEEDGHEYYTTPFPFVRTTTPQPTTRRPSIQFWKPKKNYGLDECWGRFGYCRDSRICESGQMCVQKTGYCCSPWSKQAQIVAACPGPTLMNVTCKASAPVTWCREDSHCHSAPVRLCCPTLCGYNICI